MTISGQAASLSRIAQLRFGLGLKGTAHAPEDAVAALKAQLRGPDPIRFPELVDTGSCLAQWRDDTLSPVAEGMPTRVQRILRREKALQMDAVLGTGAPFRERLVWFWANHFTVSLARLEVYPTVGAFVREAIRPHVTGRFEDMLLAVMRHPAMLMYLDNATSVGPESPGGRASGIGLNENLGRECLELHTISPEAGYSQADVTRFSEIITGWTVDFGAPRPGFHFDNALHQPGTKTVLGREFPAGEAGGVEALRWLADHPATHRFLATKLTRHFVADEPAEADVAAIAAVLRDTHGDLGAAAAALVDLPAAWVPLTKLRSPQDYVVAALRAVDLPAKLRPSVDDAVFSLGQPLWEPPLPNGWPDRAADWAGPEALLRRAEWAHGVATLAGERDVMDMAERHFGPLLSDNTRGAIRSAGSRLDALTLFLSAPEFLRR